MLFVDTIRGLSLEGPFSNLVKLGAFRADTLSETRRNADVQPLHYKRKKSYKPMQSAVLTKDVKKQKYLASMKDKRILEP